MKYLFALLLLANATQGVSQEDSIQSGSIKVEDVKMKSGDMQLQPVTGVSIATHGLPGEGHQSGFACRFPSSAPPKEPVYVIDGVISNQDALMVLNPNNIISIEVLKDATQTVNLCHRGSNGVIIIKTKNGLTKRELRKQKRMERRAAKKQAKA